MPPGSAPTGVAAAPIQGTDDQVRVSWNAVGGATGYDVERAPDAGGAPGSGTVIVTGDTASPYDDTGRTANTPYWYRVRARDGSGPGPWSGWVQAYRHLEAPTALTVAMGEAFNILTLSWSNTNGGGNARSEAMTVEWWNGGSWTTLSAAVTAGSTSYRAVCSATPRALRVKYNTEATWAEASTEYQGSAIGVGGVAKVWDELEIAAPDNRPVTEAWIGVGGVAKLAFRADLAPPSGLSVAVLSNSALRVSFTPPGGSTAVGVEGYRMYRRPGSSMGNDPATAGGFADGTGSPVDLTGLAGDTRYYIRPVSRRHGYGGPLGTEVQGITNPDPLTATPAWSLSYPKDDDGSDNRIALFANAYPDATGFEVRGRLGVSMGGSDPTGFTLVYDGPDLDTFGVFHTVTTGQTWYYRFRAKKTGLNGNTVYSPWSAEGSATAEAEVTAPGTPSVVSTTVTGPTQVTFDWATGGGGTPTQYRVERAVGGGGFAFLVNVTHPTTVYVDNAVLEGSTYQYRVRAENAAGNSAYATGASVCVGTAPGTPSWTATFPKKNGAAPTSAVDWSFTSPTGTWSTIRVRYRIGAAAWTEFTSGSLSGTRTGLQDGQTYEFQGRAENACGHTSGWSASGFVTTDLPAPTEAPSPVSAAPVQAFDDRITVTWTGPGDATGYDLEWAQSASEPVGSGTQIVGVSSPYTHTGRTANTKYWYRVRGKNTGGTGPWSGWVTATTHVQVPNLGSPATADYPAGCPTLAGITVNITHVNAAGNARSEAMTWEYRWHTSSPGSLGAWTSGGALTAGATSFNVQAAGGDGNYYIQVRVRYNSETAWRETATVNAFCFA